MTIDVTCPRCNHEFDLLHARDDDDWRELIAMILSLSPAVHRSLWAYMSLFKGKSKLRSSKMLRIVKQLAPMIKAAQIERNGISYAVPPQKFANAMDHMVNTPSPSLVLPLKSNGYLLSILANNAETLLAKAERKTEQQKQSPYRAYDTPTADHRAAKPVAMPEDFKALASRLSPILKKRLKDN